jgi:hypothetical protein
VRAVTARISITPRNGRTSLTSVVPPWDRRPACLPLKGAAAATGLTGGTPVPRQHPCSTTSSPWDRRPACLSLKGAAAATGLTGGTPVPRHAVVVAFGTGLRAGRPCHVCALAAMGTGGRGTERSVSFRCFSETLCKSFPTALGVSIPVGDVKMDQGWLYSAGICPDRANSEGPECTGTAPAC